MFLAPLAPQNHQKDHLPLQVLRSKNVLGTFAGYLLSPVLIEVQAPQNLRTYLHPHFPHPVLALKIQSLAALARVITQSTRNAKLDLVRSSCPHHSSEFH